mgnify:CR=1 FL=1
MTLQEIFAGCTAKPLLAEEPMAKHTSFRIGGPADLMAMPQSEQELQQLLQRAGESKVPVTLIGKVLICWCAIRHPRPGYQAGQYAE